jgi:type II secretory pathway component GspD/PulD (secretin)
VPITWLVTLGIGNRKRVPAAMLTLALVLVPTVASGQAFVLPLPPTAVANNSTTNETLDNDPGPVCDSKRWTGGGNPRQRRRHVIARAREAEAEDERIARVVDERKITVNFNNTPLSEAIRDLRALTDDINIVFDEESLKEEGIRKDQPVSLSASGMTFRLVLNILLSNAKLAWVIENGAITITTEAYARSKRATVTYSVADLVIPAENDPSAVRALVGYAVPKSESGQPLYELLIRLITQTIAPDSWSGEGGKGTIQYYPLGLALVVNQTRDVQEEIADLLQALRLLQKLEVAIEVRLVSVSEAFLQSIGVDFSICYLPDNFDPGTHLKAIRPRPFFPKLVPTGTPTPDLGVPIGSPFDFWQPPWSDPSSTDADGGVTWGLAFLNDIQVVMLMEAALGDRRTTFVQPPNIKVFNGQTANINPSDELAFLESIGGPQPHRVGYDVSLAVTPAVSANRRFVRLDLNAALGNLICATGPPVPVQQAVPRLYFQRLFSGAPQPAAWLNFFPQPPSASIELNKSVVVPDGGTVLIGGLKALVEGRRESLAPMPATDCPRVRRLLKNVGHDCEAQRLMIIVTGRIVNNCGKLLRGLTDSD